MTVEPYITPVDTEKIVQPLDFFKQRLTDVTSWFKEEKLEITFGESEGRPSKDYVLRREYLTRFLENGWTIDAVLENGQDGDWKAVSKSASESESHATRHDTRKDTYGSKSDSKRTEHSESASQNDSSGSNDTVQTTNHELEEHRNNEGTTAYSNGYDLSSKTSDQYTNNNKTSSTSKSSSTTDSTSETESNESHETNSVDETNDSGATTSHSGTENVAAYWAVYQRIRLKRRRLVPELVLQATINDFVDAYNQGKTADNERYMQVISLYATTLAKTEIEMEKLVSDNFDIGDLYTPIFTRLESTIEEAKKSAAKVGDTGLEAALDEIKRKFDAELSRAKSELISAGMYNGSVWISVSAGIERNRQVAIIAARSEMAKAGLDANLSIASAQTSAWNLLAEIRKASIDLLDKRRTTATEMRNNVVKIFAEIIASKKEDTPQYENFAQLVNTFGFSVGAAGNVL